MVSHKTRDPYMGSPKSGVRVRVRVSREFEREGEAMDAVREKLRGREKSREREREARLGLAEPKTSINGGSGEQRQRCMVPMREQ
jgi:hypothetical protein